MSARALCWIAFWTYRSLAVSNGSPATRMAWFACSSATSEMQPWHWWKWRTTANSRCLARHRWAKLPSALLFCPDVRSPRRNTMKIRIVTALAGSLLLGPGGGGYLLRAAADVQLDAGRIGQSAGTKAMTTPDG